MIDKKVFHEFLGEVKGVEKQKKKYEKAARIERGEREPFPYWDEVFMLLAILLFTVCICLFMMMVKITFS